LAVLLAAVGLQVAGIAIRCVLRERPPISTLYETALFISALGAIASLAIEAMSRRGIALALAPVVGGITLFLANRFEVLKGEDTMPQLQAVLDTNFWLWLHVTCINIGYTGGLLTALVAHVTVFGRAFGIQRGNEDFYRAVSRMTYGLLGFALVFSVVGTILGGIWANDSWGRFWGWDPKENGALLICLAQLAILHARLGGILKSFGVAMAAIAQGCVVAFSWWGVNLLGIGLHSYGFTGGIMASLMTFYGVEGAVLVLGLTTFLLGRASGTPAPAA
jgi:ABC-type transport system involved in cytochrome c biogenesis permease subunit